MEGVPRRQVVAQRARSLSLMTERRAAWVLRPRQFPRPAIGALGHHLLWQECVPLRRSDPHAEPVFEAGKQTNVALAAPSFDRLRLEPGAPFSFWRTLGRPTRSLGYRYGMELRGGCVVPALGGGLCLVSNALFRAAASLGWDIVERHGHTIEAVPSTETPWGLDATIAWPYVDLRFAVPMGDPAATLDVLVVGDDLVLRVWSDAPVERHVALTSVEDAIDDVAGVRTRRNCIERTIVDDHGERHDVVATNTKRLLAPADLGRSCLSCCLDDCAGRVTIR